MIAIRIFLILFPLALGVYYCYQGWLGLKQGKQIYFPQHYLLSWIKQRPLEEFVYGDQFKPKKAGILAIIAGVSAILVGIFIMFTYSKSYITTEVEYNSLSQISPILPILSIFIFVIFAYVVITKQLFKQLAIVSGLTVLMILLNFILFGTKTSDPVTIISMGITIFTPLTMIVFFLYIYYFKVYRQRK